MLRKEALAKIRKGEPVSIEFVKCDINRKTGGELIFVDNMEITGSSHNRKANATITVRQIPDGDPISIHTGLIHKVNGHFIN